MSKSTHHPFSKQEQVTDLNRSPLKTFDCCNYSYNLVFVFYIAFQNLVQSFEKKNESLLRFLILSLREKFNSFKRDNNTCVWCKRFHCSLEICFNMYLHVARPTTLRHESPNKRMVATRPSNMLNFCFVFLRLSFRMRFDPFWNFLCKTYTEEKKGLNIFKLRGHSIYAKCLYFAQNSTSVSVEYLSKIVRSGKYNWK